MLSTRWYDKDGQPASGPDGVHALHFEYSDGLQTRIVRFDEKGQPAVDSQGIYETRYGHNEKRQQNRWQYFGLNSRPAEDEEGKPPQGKRLRREGDGKSGLPA